MESIEENILEVKDTEKENFNGIMDKFLTGSGKKVEKMDLVFGNHLMETIMKDNGKITDKTVKDTFIILEDLSTEENLKIF